MRQLASTLKAIVLAVALVCFFAWLLDGSQTFQQCMQSEQQQPANHDFKDDVARLSFPLNSYRHCIYAVFEASHNELIAAFTILLAIVTLFLWWATRGLVRGAEETARRQLRAYVFVEAAGMYNVTTSSRLGGDPWL
jgi:hypothetical protein